MHLKHQPDPTANHGPSPSAEPSPPQPEEPGDPAQGGDGREAEDPIGAPDDPMARLMQQSDLERAHQALEEACARRDMAAIRLANKEIRIVRQRMADSRRKLANLMTERIHLIEVVERARMQLLRYERHLEDHDRRIEQVRAHLRQMGGRMREEPGVPILEENTPVPAPPH
ncbi:MAG: hypothetical protein HC884_11740 [Chloroflexaceae bacterium]|nr:hypothetical protein [Chloroflexaceae bacterium]